MAVFQNFLKLALNKFPYAHSGFRNGKDKKIQLSLYLTKHYAMKTYGGNGCTGLRFLDFGYSWKRVVSRTPWALYFWERAHGTLWIGVWVGPRTGLDDRENRNLLTVPGIELRLLDRPTSGQSQCRLRYRGSVAYVMTVHNSYHEVMESSKARGPWLSR
jgi:hypothetical protein